MSERIVSTVETDEGYDILEKQVAAAVAAVKWPVFETVASGTDALWNAYIGNIRPERRQQYNCRTCERFIKKYGGLVNIDTDGTAVSVMWPIGMDVPELFRDSVDAMRSLAERAKVTGIFLSSEKMWGTPRTGDWTHIHGCPMPSMTYTASPLKTADQAMAEKLEEYKMLIHGLGDYAPAVVDQALRVLRGEAVYRSEKALGVAEWLHDLQGRLGLKCGQQRSNIIWLAVATAPVGFCHIRSTIISTLLDDIIAGQPFESIARRWAEKLHPLQYQRPTAAPSIGAIEQAEKIVEKLGLARSFDRRYATLADVQETLWVNAPIDTEPPKARGVFDHLKADKQKVADLQLPAVTVTWDKFKRTVLPHSLSMQIAIPSHGPFYGLVTASDPESPAIIQWDDNVRRNPVSWYFYNNGSSAHGWSLIGGQWGNVTSVFAAPHSWDGREMGHQGESVFFSVLGCKDINGSKCGLALFPEILKAEFHGIRSVIEAHSAKGSLKGVEKGDANGLAFQKGSPQQLTLRVKTSGGMATYRLDRWD